MTTIFIILAINIIYVSFFTVRMILTLKGQKFLAAVISSLEVTIYIIGLGLVLDNLDKIQNLMAYAVGYGLGVLLGSKIEEWLALGYVTVRVITNRYDLPLAAKLREQGYGVTSWMGEGRDGPRLMLEILTRRKDQSHLYSQIIALDQHAFIISHEPRHFRGGFWVGTLKRRAKEQGETFIVLNEEVLPGVREEQVEQLKEQLIGNPSSEQNGERESPSNSR